MLLASGPKADQSPQMSIDYQKVTYSDKCGQQPHCEVWAWAECIKGSLTHSFKKVQMEIYLCHTMLWLTTASHVQYREVLEEGPNVGGKCIQVVLLTAKWQWLCCKRTPHQERGDDWAERALSTSMSSPIGVEMLHFKKPPHIHKCWGHISGTSWGKADPLWCQVERAQPSQAFL